MIKTYSKQSPTLLNIVYSMDELQYDREDITEPADFLQCALMRATNKEYKPHKHLSKGPHTVKIQEVFIVMKGQMDIDIYDIDGSFIETVSLKPGDLSILLNGGHGVKVKLAATFYEIKTGPYEGQQSDKQFL